MAWWWQQSKRHDAFKAALTSKTAKSAASLGVEAAQLRCSVIKMQFKARELALRASKQARQPSSSSSSQQNAREIVDIDQLQKRDPTAAYWNALCMQGYNKLRKWTKDLEEMAAF